MKSTITFTLPLSSTAETRVFTSVSLSEIALGDLKLRSRNLELRVLNFYLYGIILVFIGSQTKACH